MHEPYIEMIAAQALGALEAGESRSLEIHLAECSECRTVHAQLNDTAAALAYTAGEVEPSPGVRSRILENIKAEPRRTATEETGASKQSAPSNVVPITKPTRSLFRTALKYGAIAASIILAALIIATVLLWRQNQRMKAEIAQLGENANRTQQELAREREIVEAVTGPDATFLRLAGTDAAPRARARLAYDQYTGRAVLFAYDLPPAPPGKAYQLWFIAEGRPPMPGRVFKTDPTGRAMLRDEVPANGRDAKIFAVTLEPESGVQAPTSKPYLITPVS
ncbi:MAG TPA: anti-sigma factor [Pyrinomonadaceae bacterium]|nr:anti-sigma factor [Pyrinomonadaceae bacterium]